MIEIAYIVRDRRGVERLRTADKKAAEAYDRILENAERWPTGCAPDRCCRTCPMTTWRR
jgi:uncharacterized protein